MLKARAFAPRVRKIANRTKGGGFILRNEASVEVTDEDGP